MLTSPLISFIVPAYNMQNWIEETLQSVSRQSYARWECIVVDDGSTDATKDIVEKISQNDTRVKIFTQSNRGVSAARNKGLELAQGDFITFLDADDILASTFIETCLTELHMEPAAKFIACSWLRFHADTHIIHPSPWTNVHKSGNLWWDTLLDAEVAMWGSLIQRDIAIGVRFNEKLKIAEDRDYLLRVLRNIAYQNPQWIRKNDARLYFYRQRPGSGGVRMTLMIEDEWDIMNELIDDAQVPAHIRKKAYSFLALKIAIIFLCARRNAKKALQWFLRALRIDPLNMNIYWLPLRKLYTYFLPRKKVTFF